MSAWQSPGELAAQLLEKQLGLDALVAQHIVEIVIGQLGKPDRDMLQAGAAELGLACGASLFAAQHPRETARLVWCAMLERAR